MAHCNVRRWLELNISYLKRPPHALVFAVLKVQPLLHRKHDSLRRRARRLRGRSLAADRDRNRLIASAESRRNCHIDWIQADEARRKTAEEHLRRLPADAYHRRCSGGREVRTSR